MLFFLIGTITAYLSLRKPWKWWAFTPAGNLGQDDTTRQIPVLMSITVRKTMEANQSMQSTSANLFPTFLDRGAGYSLSRVAQVRR
jgi:hypothetical protein